MAGIIGYNALQSKEITVVEEKTATIVPKVATQAVVTENTVDRSKTFQATVEGTQNTSIHAFASGTVTHMYARLGERVSIGQTLAIIENPNTTTDPSKNGLRAAEINQAEIGVRQAKDAYQEAKRVYSNTKNHANEVAKDRAQLAYESAKISLQSLVDGRTLKSSVSGTVTSVSVNQNESVTMGEEILTVGIPSSLKITFFVSQLDRVDMSIGKSVEILTEGGSVSGTIALIAPQADPTTGKIAVEVRPALAKNATLLAGSAAKVRVASNNQSDKQTMFIPLEALLVGQNSSDIFVVRDGDMHSKKVSVDVVHIQGGIAQISTENLKDSDRIIISHVHLLDDGEEVAIDTK